MAADVSSLELLQSVFVDAKDGMVSVHLSRDLLQNFLDYIR